MGNELYFLNIAKGVAPAEPNNGTALTIVPSFDLAHKQLAHPGKDALQLMIQKRLVMGLDNVPDQSAGFDCEACIHGKMM